MGFQAFGDAGGGGLAVTAPAKGASGTADLSALEWSVVAIAGRDRLSSLREPGRVAMALGTLFGRGTNPRLADPRLEALRRLAVLTWHHGYAVPVSAIKAFLAAGFSTDQYETVAASIETGRTDRRRQSRHSRRVA